MANLRSIKKDIEYITDEIIEDCFLSLEFRPEQGDRILEIMNEAVNTRNELIEMANHPADKHNPSLVRKHYGFLRRTMFERADSLFSRLSELNK